MQSMENDEAVPTLRTGVAGCPRRGVVEEWARVFAGALWRERGDFPLQSFYDEFARKRPVLYRKFALEVFVTDGEAECLTHALSCAIDKTEEQVTVFGSDIKVVDTDESDNAKEIAASVD